MERIRVFAIGLAVLAAGASPGGAAQDLPIFDVHIHYSRPAWDAYPPEPSRLARPPSPGDGRRLAHSPGAG